MIYKDEYPQMAEPEVAVCVCFPIRGVSPIRDTP
ncbi:Uncharacterised protein [Escherichia coli]|uniref:Uncharacterized protein n=1 Tax=Escherichia coli TaxID=562 RepID=A0A377C9T2_ECOLX|nr:Uncharacterised protein [Escherichia coli]